MVPGVSVVIPVYNGAEFLSKAIESVKTQSLRDWELVIVDDGSIDSTWEIAQRHAAGDRRIQVIRQPNGGVAIARNRGSAEADAGTPAFIFLDADDYLQPNALEALSTSLERHPNMVAVYGLSRYVDATGSAVRGDEGERRSRQRYSRRGSRLKPDPSTGSLTFATLARKNVVLSSGAMLIRGIDLRQAGGFDQSIAPVADWDMWLRLASRGEIGLLNSLVLNYRQHGASMSHNSGGMLRASRAMYRKHLAFTEYRREQMQLLRIGRRYLRMYALAQRYLLARRCLSQREWHSALQHVCHALGDLR